jgi:alkylation response protein AidB-like acyl-CoA dehydrogenase
VVVARDAPGVAIAPAQGIDPSVEPSLVTLSGVAPGVVLDATETVLARLLAVGSVMAAAEAAGAAAAVLELARSYAGERKQFGRTIGSFQALRHLLADMYVKQDSAWSTVLFAAAALDDGNDEALQTASIAKAYVSRAAREVAQDALQVFGGIAFTAEHPAHRFLRRILARGQQFGDARHHERAIGRALVGHATGTPA